MKNLTPRQVALYASGTVSLVILVLLLIANHWLGAEWYILLGVPGINFVITYFLLLYFIERFIYRKIKLIYKHIHDLKTPKGQLPSSVDVDADIITKVESEVMEWTEGKTMEIETLKQSEIYRKEFIGDVSHELKTPIFNIQGYIHTLIDGGMEDDKINKSYLYKAAKNIDRLNSIVNDLETINTLESDRLTLDVVRFDIIELIMEVFDAQDMQADLRDVQLVFKKGVDKTPRYVMADRDRIRQVLTNLVTNAIKYNKEKGEVRIGVDDMHDNYLIEVSDSGLGIAEEHLPRLFERFYRVDKSRARDIGGTGLGLAIVKHIIEVHEQTITVRSTLGVGSTFGFTLKRG